MKLGTNLFKLLVFKSASFRLLSEKPAYFRKLHMLPWLMRSAAVKQTALGDQFTLPCLGSSCQLPPLCDSFSFSSPCHGAKIVHCRVQISICLHNHCQQLTIISCQGCFKATDSSFSWHRDQVIFMLQPTSSWETSESCLFFTFLKKFIKNHYCFLKQAITPHRKITTTKSNNHKDLQITFSYILYTIQGHFV